MQSFLCVDHPCPRSFQYFLVLLIIFILLSSLSAQFPLCSLLFLTIFFWKNFLLIVSPLLFNRSTTRAGACLSEVAECHAISTAENLVNFFIEKQLFSVSPALSSNPALGSLVSINPVFHLLLALVTCFVSATFSAQRTNYLLPNFLSILALQPHCRQTRMCLIGCMLPNHGIDCLILVVCASVQTPWQQTLIIQRLDGWHQQRLWNWMVMLVVSCAIFQLSLETTPWICTRKAKIMVQILSGVVPNGFDCFFHGFNVVYCPWLFSHSTLVICQSCF